MRFSRLVLGILTSLFLLQLHASAHAQALLVDGMSADIASRSITLGGTHRYDSIRVIRGGVINVAPFNGNRPREHGQPRAHRAHDRR